MANRSPKRFRLRTVWLLPLLAAAPVYAAGPRFPVTLASVAAALAAQQPQIAASSLEVPAVTASTSDPALVVESVAPAGSDTARVRMACASSTNCLPFFVLVHSAGKIAFSPSSATRTATPRSAQAPPALRSGAHAVLVIDSGTLHITMGVVALASGRVGDAVRVASLDRRMTYTARILSADEVRGSL